MEAAIDAVGAADTASGEYAESIGAALTLDALCGLAWFNLGVLGIREGNRESAFMSFLCAAVIQSNDVEAWCNALGLTLDPNTDRLRYFPYIVASAHFANRERFLEEAGKFAARQDQGFPSAQFLNLINEALKQSPQPRQTLLARIFSSNEHSHEIQLSEGGLMSIQGVVAPTVPEQRQGD